jgi:hypothetical protein
MSGGEGRRAEGLSAGREISAEVQPGAAVLYCANHPTRETTLRCNRCGKPICTSCAVRTPVGYRCKECVRGQQAVFDTAGGAAPAVGAVVSAIGAGAALVPLSFLGFWGLLLAPVAGGALAEVVRWAVRRRRHRRLPLSAAVGGGVGVLGFVLIQGAPFLVLGLSGEPGALAGVGFSLLWPLAYGALLVSTLYSRLRGIRLSR